MIHFSQLKLAIVWNLQNQGEHELPRCGSLYNLRNVVSVIPILCAGSLHSFKGTLSVPCLWRQERSVTWSVSACLPCFRCRARFLHLQVSTASVHVSVWSRRMRSADSSTEAAGSVFSRCCRRTAEVQSARSLEIQKDQCTSRSNCQLDRRPQALLRESA